jgi:hypothetical protein
VLIRGSFRFPQIKNQKSKIRGLAYANRGVIPVEESKLEEPFPKQYAARKTPCLRNGLSRPADLSKPVGWLMDVKKYAISSGSL